MTTKYIYSKAAFVKKFSKQLKKEGLVTHVASKTDENINSRIHEKLKGKGIRIDDKTYKYCARTHARLESNDASHVCTTGSLSPRTMFLRLRNSTQSQLERELGEQRYNAIHTYIYTKHPNHSWRRLRPRMY